MMTATKTKPASPKTKKASTTTTKKVPAKKGTKRDSSNDRVQDGPQAKKLGLSIPQFRVLRYLSLICKGDASARISYADINAATGYYSNLTTVLRKSKEGSLCHQGLVKEWEEEGKVRFSITAKGQKALEKATSPASPKKG